MFRRKLLALNCPFAAFFNIENEELFRKLIVWLEDLKICHLNMEEKIALRNINSAQWENIFQNYLVKVKCPYAANCRRMTLDWILTRAVRKEYAKNIAKYRDITPEKVAENLTHQQGATASNPLDNLNFDDPEFKAGVKSLARLLEIPPHPDHCEQLKAICILVKEKLSQQAIKERAAEQGKKDEHIPLEQTELGFDTGSAVTNDAAKILRLLHIKELRDLQDGVNSAIVAVQAIIADPKIDSRLGKVGH